MLEEPFLIDIRDLVREGGVRERFVKYWRETIRADRNIAPIKIRKSPRYPSHMWLVVSGAEAVEAARREGLAEIICAVI